MQRRVSRPQRGCLHGFAKAWRAKRHNRGRSALARRSEVVDFRTLLGSHPSLARVIQVIAAAFEVSHRDVVADAMALQHWPAKHGAEADAAVIRRWLQRRHDWDDSVPPYYLDYIYDVLAQGHVRWCLGP